MKKTKLYLNYAGFCWAKERDAIRDGKRVKIKFKALWGLIKHPEEGLILFDTGYTSRFFNATEKYPNKIYSLITKVEVNEEDEIVNQLINANINPNSIKKILISHFHADHVCGLKDFPKATIYTSKKALKYTLGLNRLIAFSKGVLKELIPEDISDQVVYFEDCKKLKDDHFGYSYNLFGDDSLKIYELPGHAKGQCGVILETEKKRYFLVGDACWLSRSYIQNIPPNPIVRVFFDSWREFRVTLDKIHNFSIKNPETIIIPSHCAETTDPLVSNELDFDKL